MIKFKPINRMYLWLSILLFTWIANEPKNSSRPPQFWIAFQARGQEEETGRDDGRKANLINWVAAVVIYIWLSRVYPEQARTALALPGAQCWLLTGLCTFPTLSSRGSTNVTGIIPFSPPFRYSAVALQRYQPGKTLSIWKANRNCCKIP